MNSVIKACDGIPRNGIVLAEESQAWEAIFIHL